MLDFWMYKKDSKIHNIRIKKGRHGIVITIRDGIDNVDKRSLKRSGYHRYYQILSYGMIRRKEILLKASLI